MHENYSRVEEVKVSSDRSFGVVFLFMFLALGLWLVSGGHTKGWIFLVLSIGLFLVILRRPSVLSPLNLAWFRFGLFLGRLVNPIILGVIFFLVITPIAVIRRLLSKDSLHLKFKPKLKSYWIDRNPIGSKPSSMTRQF